jgi:hypothetical protein
MRLNMTPGLFELVGTGDGTAATLLAAVIAKEARDPYWIASPHGGEPALIQAAGCNPWYEGEDRAYYALLGARSIADLGPHDLVVIDCLADMRGVHPEARTIAADVKRAIMGWEPTIPILVVNNWRNPAPPGGVYWRGRANSRRLIALREEPLIALLDDFQEGHAPLFLVWYPPFNFGPTLRPLLSIEWLYFFPDGVPGWQVFKESGRLAISSTGQRPGRRPWLIERKVSR